MQHSLTQSKLVEKMFFFADTKKHYCHSDKQVMNCTVRVAQKRLNSSIKGYFFSLLLQSHLLIKP